MNVRTLCLAILSVGESTGYDIRKLSTEGHYSHFVDASYGSIYPALTKLEQDGMVESREEKQSGKPSRKVYTITDAGRGSFMSALSKPVQRDIFKSEFMLIAMFAEIMNPADVTRAIDAQIDWLKNELATIDAAQEEIDFDGANWVADYGRCCLQASLDYITNSRSGLEAIAGRMLENETDRHGQHDAPLAAE